MEEEINRLAASCSHWTLADDSDLCSLLEKVNESVRATGNVIDNRIKGFNKKVKQLDANIENINCSISLLANNKFIEQRVAEDVTTRPFFPIPPPNAISLAERQADSFDAVHCAVRAGLQLMKKSEPVATTIPTDSLSLGPAGTLDAFASSLPILIGSTEILPPPSRISTTPERVIAQSPTYEVISIPSQTSTAYPSPTLPQQKYTPISRSTPIVQAAPKISPKPTRNEDVQHQNGIESEEPFEEVHVRPTLPPVQKKPLFDPGSSEDDDYIEEQPPAHSLPDKKSFTDRGSKVDTMSNHSTKSQESEKTDISTPSNNYKQANPMPTMPSAGELLSAANRLKKPSSTTSQPEKQLPSRLPDPVVVKPKDIIPTAKSNGITSTIPQAVVKQPTEKVSSRKAIPKNLFDTDSEDDDLFKSVKKPVAAESKSEDKSTSSASIPRAEQAAPLAKQVSSTMAKPVSIKSESDRITTSSKITTQGNPETSLNTTTSSSAKIAAVVKKSIFADDSSDDDLFSVISKSNVKKTSTTSSNNSTSTTINSKPNGITTHEDAKKSSENNTVKLPTTPSQQKKVTNTSKKKGLFDSDSSDFEDLFRPVAKTTSTLPKPTTTAAALQSNQKATEKVEKAQPQTPADLSLPSGQKVPPPSSQHSTAQKLQTEVGTKSSVSTVSVSSLKEDVQDDPLGSVDLITVENETTSNKSSPPQPKSIPKQADSFKSSSSNLRTIDDSIVEVPVYVAPDSPKSPETPPHQHLCDLDSDQEEDMPGKLSNSAFASMLNSTLSKGPPPPGGMRPPGKAKESPTDDTGTSFTAPDKAATFPRGFQLPKFKSDAEEEAQTPLFADNPKLLDSVVRNRTKGPSRRPPSKKHEIAEKVVESPNEINSTAPVKETEDNKAPAIVTEDNSSKSEITVSPLATEEEKRKLPDIETVKIEASTSKKPSDEMSTKPEDNNGDKNKYVPSPLREETKTKMDSTLLSSSLSTTTAKESEVKKTKPKTLFETDSEDEDYVPPEPLKKPLQVQAYIREDPVPNPSPMEKRLTAESNTPSPVNNTTTATVSKTISAPKTNAITKPVRKSLFDSDDDDLDLFRKK